MVKVCKKQFPLIEGDKSYRQSDGFSMDDFLYDNIKPLGTKLLNDWSFIILITGSGWVRVGKSIIAQQIAAVLNEETNNQWHLNNTFDCSNILFKGNDLIDQSFVKPKGSVLLLDEGDDLTEHYASEIAYTMRRYLRKCGQLNQILIVILPDFFDLPRSLAMSRSICLIDVYPSGELDRGFYRFFDFQKKKDLYLLGKKMHNYKAVEPNFNGRFPNFYTVNKEEYLKKKHDDLIKEDDNERPSKRGSKYVTWDWNIKRDEWFIKHNLSIKEFIEANNGDYDSYKSQKNSFKSTYKPNINMQITREVRSNE